eukprot:NODE_228_length_13820_cov_0.664893.p4 type:complete len:296 gc:universal NODE_228_length_13820_cov_0.664893:13355-12468(-)
MILVTGATGLLGSAVYKQLKAHYLVLGTCHNSSNPDLFKIDLTDKLQIDGLFITHSFHSVIHLVAERQPDAFKSDISKAKQVTEGTTKYLLQACINNDIPLIFISTDYVFDGKQPPYFPTDLTNPLSDYGKSKVIAENCVLGYKKGIIIRVPVLYGHLTKVNDGAIDSLVGHVMDKSKRDVDNYCKRFPANVLDVADMLVAFYAQLHKNKLPKAIYHFCGPKCFTKYEMCKIMAKAMNASYDHLNPINKQVGEAVRPFDVELDTSDLSEFVGYDIRAKQIDFEQYWTKKLNAMNK